MNTQRKSLEQKIEKITNTYTININKWYNTPDCIKGDFKYVLTYRKNLQEEGRQKESKSLSRLINNLYNSIT